MHSKLENKTLFTRKDIMKRWGISYQSIVNYENSGLLTRNPFFECPMYYEEEILKIESLNDFNPLSPIERKRLEKCVETLKKECAYLHQKIESIKAALI